jgi:hypothetical protein
MTRHRVRAEIGLEKTTGKRVRRSGADGHRDMNKFSWAGHAQSVAPRAYNREEAVARR